MTETRVLVDVSENAFDVIGMIRWGVAVNLVRHKRTGVQVYCRAGDPPTAAMLLIADAISTGEYLGQLRCVPRFQKTCP